MWSKVVVSSLLLVASATIVLARAEPETVELQKPLFALPAQLGDWSLAASQRLRPEIRQVLGGDDDLVRTYVRDGWPDVSLMLVYWASQSGDRMIHDPETCLPGAGWSVDESNPVILGDTTVQRYRARRGRSEVLFYTWYVQGGAPVANALVRRLTMTRAYFTGRTEGAMIRTLVFLDGSRSGAEVENALSEFSAALMPELEEVLPR